jgi:hypothetical protein
MSLLPQLIADVDDARVESDGGIVDEEAIVHLSHIHAPDASGYDRLHRLVEPQRNVKILREVIERAERQDAERTVRIYDAGGNTADRPIAAGSHNDRSGRASRSSGVSRIVPYLQEVHFGLGTRSGKQLRDPAIRPAHTNAARRRIQEHRHGGHQTFSAKPGLNLPKPAILEAEALRGAEWEFTR